MELFMSLLLLLGGVAVFIHGMQQMGKGMEQSAGAGIRRLFKKLSKNRVTDYGVGIAATVLVQSSSATSIMTVGLANADIVDLKQGSGIILGAKVGTTLTAFVFALSGVSNGGFSIGTFFSSLAFVGIIMLMTTNKENLRKIALFLLGLGLLFLGLEVMEFAIGGKDSLLSSKLTELFHYDFMMNPILLILLGIVFTCIIQSSTAATGVFIAFLKTGVLSSVDQSFFLIMGANIGTCSDGLLASIGANTTGKRIALFHVLTSTIGAALFSVILVIFRTSITDLFNSLFALPEWSLAVYNLAYNTIYTLILLAVLTPLLALVSKMLKDKQKEEEKKFNIDERLLNTPAVAIEQAVKEVKHMSSLAMQNLTRSFDCMIKDDLSQSKQIANDEYTIDNMTRALASYFIKISATHISYRDEKLIGSLHHVINDLERIGDHAVLLAKETNFMLSKNLNFIDQTKTELQSIFDKTKELYMLSMEAFNTRKTQNLKQIATLHQQIIDDINQARDQHITRLSANEYSVEVSKSLYAVLLSLHRVADHIVNIAFSIKSNTGSKTEAFTKLEQSKKKN